jgi:hypothetical protein
MRITQGKVDYKFRARADAYTGSAVHAGLVASLDAAASARLARRKAAYLQATEVELVVRLAGVGAAASAGGSGVPRPRMRSRKPLSAMRQAASAIRPAPSPGSPEA